MEDEDMEPEAQEARKLVVLDRFEKMILASPQGKEWYEITAKEWGKATNDQLQHIIKGTMVVLQRIAQNPTELETLKLEELGERTLKAIQGITIFTLALDYLIYKRTNEKKQIESEVAYG